MVVPKTGRHDDRVDRVIGKPLNARAVCSAAAACKMVVGAGVHHGDHVFKTAGVFPQYVIRTYQRRKSLAFIGVVVFGEELACRTYIHEVFGAGREKEDQACDD